MKQFDDECRLAISRFLREARRVNRLTVREVVESCRRAGWRAGATSINRIERTGEISYSRSLILCKIYGVSVREIGVLVEDAWSKARATA